MAVCFPGGRVTCNSGAHKLQVTWKPKNLIFPSQETYLWVTESLMQIWGGGLGIGQD